MKKILITIPLAILAILAVGAFAAPSVQAHDGTASGTCQGGVQWNYHNYDQNVTNTITVTIDGVVRYHDGDFKTSDSGTIATDKTVAHSWDVLVNAPGTQFDRHPSGSYAACVVVPTTTAAPTTTTVPIATTTAPPVTSVEPNVTTTSVVAVDIPPVPTTLALIPPVIIAADASVQPALPVTGGGDEVAFIAIAAGLIAVGVYLVIRGRRVP